MKVVGSPSPIRYDGSQLRSHWIYSTFGVQGDAIAHFTGPADVDTSHLVDISDQRDEAVIRARDMLHFIVEHFDPDILRAVLRQRMLCAIAAEVIGEACQRRVCRRGDDLYVEERKLSVSIATVSPVSALVHLGINIDPVGSPVPAVGLGELGVEVGEVAGTVAQRYAEEMRQVGLACTKVRWVP